MNKALTVVIWIAISAIVLLLVTVPVSLQAHLVMGAILLGAMLVIKILRLDGNWRLLLLTFGTIIVLRYAFWRTTSTMVEVSHLADPGLLVEIQAIAAL